MEYKVVLHEEYEELKKKSDQYTEKLSGLIEEYSYIISHEYNRILTEYILKIGSLEYEEFEIYTKVETLKRKIQLINTFLNHDVEAPISAIDKQVEKEFQGHYEKLQSMKEDLEIAKILEYADSLSLEDAMELKRFYKNLVKNLHPDVNANGTEKEETLWLQALEAYQNNDLDMLYNLTDIIASTEKDLIDAEIENAIEIVRGKCDRLKERIEKYILKIAEIKNTFPFNKADFLKSKSQIEERQKEINESISEWKNLYLELEKNITP